MKVDQLDELIGAAHFAGILPASAARPEIDVKPWPLVLMIGLGAWLSVIPLIAFVAFAGGEALFKGGAAFTLGALLIGTALWILRGDSISIFVEQLGLPVLLTGGGLLYFGLVYHMPAQTACLITAVVSVLISALAPRPWLRGLLGAVACSLVTFHFIIKNRDASDSLWIAAHATMFAWLVASALRRSLLNEGSYATLAATVESAGAGWLIVTLFSLAAWSGATFMFGAAFGLGSGNIDGPGPANYLESRYVVSAGAAAFGAGWLAKSWPMVRSLPALIVAIVAVGASWLNPTLGATFLALACCMASGRWRLASSAGIATAWIIGAFYYQLSLPLASKAVVMLGAAATLGCIAWLIYPKANRAAIQVPRLERLHSFRLVAMAVSGIAVLAVVNTGILQKERLIAQSRLVYVELAPVDPRSIMQGDYMALDFRLPTSVQDKSAPCDDNHCNAVATVDVRGVVSVSRLSSGHQLNDGEFRIGLTKRAGRWAMVSDAWHFSEGEAERWAKAKYGEFRVDSTGRAMLVGMRGPNLEVL